MQIVASTGNTLLLVSDKTRFTAPLPIITELADLWETSSVNLAPGCTGHIQNGHFGSENNQCKNIK